MTRIDFYIIETNTLQARLLFACKLITKAYSLGHRVYIHCHDQAMAMALDALLWGIQEQGVSEIERQRSRFIPHDLAEEGSGGTTCIGPICIGTQAPPADYFDLYVNLSQQTPPQFTRFNRLIELIDQEKTVLDYGRINYRHYQQKHYPLHRHDLRKSIA